MSAFLPLPLEYCRRDTARFQIIPIPYEGTVCFGHGTVNGPERICAVSDQMEYIDEETVCEFWRDGIFTHEPIPSRSDPAEQMALIESTVRRAALFSENRFPILLGGEHSVTAPAIRVAAESFSNLSVLQFDAHSDLRDVYEPGGKFSHASVMRRVTEITPTLVQVGIRSFSGEDLIACPERVKNFITPSAVEENTDQAIRTVLNRLTDTVYITFDMDAFDPSVAPGVGTPEPGGLLWRPVLRMLRAVFNAKRVVGADVVETAPVAGSNLTEYVAARLTAKMITYKTLGK